MSQMTEKELKKPFKVEFGTNFNFDICRADYENMPDPMKGHLFTDEQMEELAEMTSDEMKLYSFECMDKKKCTERQKEEVEDVFWREMENCAVKMGMGYYEDDVE